MIFGEKLALSLTIQNSTIFWLLLNRYISYIYIIIYCLGDTTANEAFDNLIIILFITYM